MAAAVGTPYSPPSPPDTSSSTTMSPVYPDRLIRPLPKRSLRERLSPEVAEQIPYPSVSPAESPFNGRYGGASGQRSQNGVAGSLQEIDRYDRALIEAQGDCDDNFDRVGMFNRFKDFNENGISFAEATHGIPRATQTIAHSIASSADSIDGYDSFENTNNKKKRKIPLSGGLGSHPPNLSISLSNDLANMGLSHSRDADDLADNADEGLGQYYGGSPGASASGTGISGAGRGRFGRTGRRDASGRAPLAVSGNAGNLTAGRASLNNPAAAGQGSKEHGIISAAIAEAATSPVTATRGQENISLLEQYPQKHPAPANTQFTFTCESDASKNTPWPHNHGPNGGEPCPACPPPASHSATTNLSSFSQKGFSTQGTQTSPVMSGQQGAPVGQGHGTQQPPAQPKKPRRPASKRYAMAARERRLQQEYDNYHRPPREEDIWICEFCEYEAIFGVPPAALVRQYEIKDRRERKRMAEKRRLLEKAKLKGRKGKKGTKNAAKNNAAAQSPYNDKQQTPVQMADAGMSHSQATQSDEYYGEDYDDEPPMAAPMPSDLPTRIPQPVAQHSQNPRLAQAGESYAEGKT